MRRNEGKVESASAGKLLVGHEAHEQDTQSWSNVIRMYRYITQSLSDSQIILINFKILLVILKLTTGLSNET